MVFSNKKQIFATLFAVAIFVLILLAPKKQEKKVENNEKANTSVSDKKLTLDEALELIKTGKDPMTGIFRIREIADNDHNIEAQAHMLVFSIQSGQMGKAKERFKHFVEHNPTPEQKQKVIEILENSISENVSESFVLEIKKYINELKTL